MTQDEIIEMARQAGFVDYELDDGTTNAFDKRYEAFAKLVAEKEYEKTSAWYRKLIADIVESIHKEYEKKPFRTRTIRKEKPIKKYNG